MRISNIYLNLLQVGSEGLHHAIPFNERRVGNDRSSAQLDYQRLEFSSSL